MSRTRVSAILTAGLLVIAPLSLRADVRADQKTHVEFAGMLGRMMNLFGGRGAKDGATSSVAVKGDRKAAMSDTTGQIIDLAEEKVYDLDMRKKSYTVTTFAELRRKMEEARKKAEENARNEQSREASPPADENGPEMEVDVDVKNTGEKKAVNGFDTHQAVMTITVREKGKTVEQAGGMILTSDMWLTSKIAAMQDIADFDMRYAKQLYGTMLAGVSADQMAAAVALYPMMKQALARMGPELQTIEGTPILVTTTMDTVKSEAQVAEEARQSGSDAKSSDSGGLGGLVGGFAKRMAQKKAGGDDTKPRTTFMTTTNEVLKVATDVSAADVAVPVGFKEKK
jgi:hypothetical protein